MQLSSRIAQYAYTAKISLYFLKHIKQVLYLFLFIGSAQLVAQPLPLPTPPSINTITNP